MKKLLCMALAMMLCAGVFAPGAFAAAKKPSDAKGQLDGKIIGLDPGHQKKKNDNPEPIGPGASKTKKSVSSGTRGIKSRTWEHEINLAVALKLRALLEAEGATVIMTRETADVNVPNSERATMMNDAGADLVLRLHCDGNRSPKVNGTSMLVPSGKYCEAIEVQSLKAGKLILASFLYATGSKDRGVRKRSDQTGFNWSSVPICNIEMGFLTNETEDALLNTEEYQALCAKALKDGIVAYFKS